MNLQEHKQAYRQAVQTVKDTKRIFNKKYIPKKSLKNNLILLNALQGHASCIFAAKLENSLFWIIVEQTLY